MLPTRSRRFNFTGSLIIHLIGGVAIAGAIVLPGCGPLVLEGGPSVQTVMADWDDIDAAVTVGLTNGECAIVGSPRVSADRREYALRSINDDRGILVISRDPNAAANHLGSIPMTIEARIGEPRDATREGRLVAAVRRRLMQLAGVETAPGDE